MRPFLALFTLALAASAATSTAWETTGFADLLKGRLAGLSLAADGVLSLGPALRFEATLDQPALWSLAPGPDNSLYAATGHQGKVFRIASDGRATLLWSAEQSEVFALAVTPQGALYVGTSPNGGLFRIENGKAQEVWHSAAKYIWSIAPAPDGSLYVATGENGRIYRIDAAGRASLYYETGQSNVTAIALAPNGHVYAGTDPNGLLYDVSGPNQATILYDSSLPEIRAIAVSPTGAVYAAALGGAVATRSAAASAGAAYAAGPVVAATPTVITVTESAAHTADTDQTAAKPAADAAKAGSSTSSSAAASNTAVVEVSGVEKSAIYRIDPSSGAAQTLRSSKEDNVFDLLLDGDSVLFSTDDHGRIYRMTDSKTTLVSEPGSGETTRLLQTRSGLYAALSNPARLFSFGPAGSAGGFYESQVHDSTSVARWGHLQWRVDGSGLAFRTRTGNSSRPDATWSAWSAPISTPPVSIAASALLKSPPARFIQWRAEWPAGSNASLSSVTVPYLPQNGPPSLRSITVTSILGSNTAKAAANVSSASSAYSVTVTENGEPPAATSTTTPTQTASRLQTTQTQISWQADDPDFDKLVYSVYFRAEDERDWQLIRSRMFENTLLLDPDVFADGRYFFRVVASDAPSNAAEFAREAELVSSPVLIDNTPPVVTPGAPTRNGASLDIDLEAADNASALRLCEYSLDAGFWQPIESIDGITDSPRERFHLHLDKLRPGEHLLVFRVYDAANNAGLARVILR